MGDVVSFQRRAPVARRAKIHLTPEQAEILFFIGVRYERASEPAPVVLRREPQKPTPTPTRPRKRRAS